MDATHIIPWPSLEYPYSLVTSWLGRNRPSFRDVLPSVTMHPTLPLLRTLPFSQPFKRASLGLFHGKTKLYGNNVPFSLHKTRRTWLPNSHSKALYSEVMKSWITVTVTARTLRTVDKVRGVACDGEQVLITLWGGWSDGRHR